MQASDKSEFTLYYFKLHVRGDAMRALLHHANASYEDKHVSFQEWKDLKPTIPSGQLPCIEFDNGKKMGESMAITRYLGMKFGYYPEDSIKAFECDMLLDMYADVVGKVYKPHFQKDEAKRDTMMPEIVEAVKKFLDRAAPHFDGHYLVGDKLSIADFWIGGLYTNYLANPEITFGKEQFAEILAAYPAFESYGKRYADATSSYISSRAKYPI